MNLAYSKTTYQINDVQKKAAQWAASSTTSDGKKKSHQGNARAAHWAASSYTWKFHLFSNLVFLKLIQFIYMYISMR